jgi:hypothetical protein
MKHRLLRSDKTVRLSRPNDLDTKTWTYLEPILSALNQAQIPPFGALPFTPGSSTR